MFRCSSSSHVSQSLMPNESTCRSLSLLLPTETQQTPTFPSTIGARRKSQWFSAHSFGDMLWHRFLVGSLRSMSAEKLCCLFPLLYALCCASWLRHLLHLDGKPSWHLESYRDCARAAYFRQLILCWLNGWVKEFLLGYFMSHAFCKFETKNWTKCH